MEEIDYSELDPGIRTAVKFLRDNGFNTTDSGDGYSKPKDPECVMDMPHVAMFIEPAEALVSECLRLQALVEEHQMLPAVPIGAGTGPEIQGTYDPVTKTSIILLLGFTLFD